MAALRGQALARAVTAAYVTGAAETFGYAFLRSTARAILVELVAVARIGGLEISAQLMQSLELRAWAIAAVGLAALATAQAGLESEQTGSAKVTVASRSGLRVSALGDE
jgi:hypothetical protein